MLPPDYLVNNIDRIAVMFSNLHTALSEEIARHIADTLKATGTAGLMPSAAYQAERLNHAGMLHDDIAEKIAALSSMSREEVARIFMDAAVETLVYDNAIYEAAGFKPISIPQSPEMLRILQAGISKTHGSLERLTGTIAINAEDRFEELLNLGYNKVASGAYTYSQAIESAVDELAREGVKLFSYSSGRRISLEAAVRMNVLTGVNQTAAEITRQGMASMGVSLVRTTAHLGARNKGEGFVNHESWQGKIFRWKELDEGASGLTKGDDGGIIETYNKDEDNNVIKGLSREDTDSIISPMDKEKFNRIKSAFERNGGLIQSDADTDIYLKRRKSEGITYNEKTILLKTNASASAVFEELIHATQYRQKRNDGSVNSRLLMEIEAQEKLIKYRKAYGITDIENNQTIKALEHYRKELKEFVSREGE